jgi:hypothetical protein
MGKTRKILALVTGMGAASCASPAAPLLKGSGELVSAAGFALSRAEAVSRPLTTPDGRPVCGNVVGKGPRPPECV